MKNKNVSTIKINTTKQCLLPTKIGHANQNQNPVDSDPLLLRSSQADSPNQEHLRCA